MEATIPDEITNSEDVIDSRDIIARIEWLESFEGDEDALSEAETDELKALRELAKEAEGYSEDWTYGATLIRDSYMEHYAQETTEDIGAINPKATWPLHCIDWEQATREFKIDYTEVDFDGVSYWIR